MAKITIDADTGTLKAAAHAIAAAMQTLLTDATGSAVLDDRSSLDRDRARYVALGAIQTTFGGTVDHDHGRFFDETVDAAISLAERLRTRSAMR